jgi:hypothetical protein
VAVRATVDLSEEDPVVLKKMDDSMVLKNKRVPVKKDDSGVKRRMPRSQRMKKAPLNHLVVMAMINDLSKGIFSEKIYTLI